MMPIKHTVSADGKLMRVRRWGHISTHDEEKAYHERLGDPRVVPGIAVLADCTEVEPPDTTATVKYLADFTSHIAAELQCGPLAIVVSSDVEYGMARMYMAYTELRHPRTEIFRSESEALAWLAQAGRVRAVQS